ncbi:MAG: hypothetical protein INR63_26700 [Actinomycetospora chiangmaiensis]|jgi:hypothetical protein|nr:hypothetical protein [Actinomycetospora chiangmaiensis]
MTVIKPQASIEVPSSAQTAEPVRAPGQSSCATLIPFPGAEVRRSRRIPRADEQRGEILLFLGVRYERLAS